MPVQIPLKSFGAEVRFVGNACAAIPGLGKNEQTGFFRLPFQLLGNDQRTDGAVNRISGKHRKVPLKAG